MKPSKEIRGVKITLQDGKKSAWAILPFKDAQELRDEIDKALAGGEGAEYFITTGNEQTPGNYAHISFTIDKNYLSIGIDQHEQYRVDKDTKLDPWGHKIRGFVTSPQIRARRTTVCEQVGRDEMVRFRDSLIWEE